MLNVDEPRRNGMSDVGPSPADRLAEEILYQRVQAWLKDRFREAELLEPGAHVDSAVREAIGKVMQAYRREAAIAGTPGLDDPAGVEQRLADRVLGFGYLAPLLADPDIEEIQAIGGRVRIYRHGRWELVEHLAPDDAETLRLVRRLLAPGDRIDESSPEVESTLPDGSRLTAVIPPETEQVTLTIRRYVVRHHRLADLGTLPSEAVALVEAYAGRGKHRHCRTGRRGQDDAVALHRGSGRPQSHNLLDRRRSGTSAAPVSPRGDPAVCPSREHRRRWRTHVSGADAHRPAAPTGCPGGRRVPRRRSARLASCRGNGPPVSRNPPL